MENTFNKYLRGKSVESLLSLHSAILKHLKEAGVIRTLNNPVGDYGEYVAAKVFKLQLAPNSTKSYDAIDKLGNKYQIKSRRVSALDKSRQLGVIRNLDTADFKFLIVVLFNESYVPEIVYRIPKALIRKYARFSVHQNGYILIMKGPILMTVGYR